MAHHLAPLAAWPRCITDNTVPFNCSASAAGAWNRWTIAAKASRSHPPLQQAAVVQPYTRTSVSCLLPAIWSQWPLCDHSKHLYHAESAPNELCVNNVVQQNSA
jgi:hypothetical protein